MNRCLAIAGVFSPYGGAGVVRQVKLFSHLRAHGWQVDVIAPRGRAGWFLDRELEQELDGLRVTRVGLPGLRGPDRLRSFAKDPEKQGRAVTLLRGGMKAARAMRNLVAIPDERVAWSAVALAYARTRLARERYDALFTSAPPYSTHLVGLGLRRSGGPPWLAEHRDPWADHRFRAHGLAWRRFVDDRLEAAVMDHADAVNVISPAMAKSCQRRFGQALAAKLHVIPNGFDERDFDATLEHHPRSEPFELVYAGTLDAGLTPPDTLLDGLAGLGRAARGRVQLRVVGGADLETTDRLRAWMARHGADRIRVEGFTSHRQATRAMAGADALVLCLAPGASWVLTSKVFEYLASGRPILAVVPPGDCRDLLARCGGAVIVEPGDGEGVSQYLGAALALGELEVTARRRDVIAEYAYPEIAGRVAQVLTAIAGSP